MGYRMNASAIRDLHYEWRFKILSKSHEALSQFNLKELPNIKSSVNTILL